MKNHSQAHFSTACNSFEDDSFLLSRYDKSVGSSFAQTQLNVKSGAVFAFRLIVIDSIQAFCAECALLSGNYNQPTPPPTLPTAIAVGGQSAPEAATFVPGEMRWKVLVTFCDCQKKEPASYLISIS